MVRISSRCSLDLHALAISDLIPDCLIAAKEPLRKKI